MTNRELASRLGVDPGHLHFHVRMLLRAGLIELAERRPGPREAVPRGCADGARRAGAAEVRGDERPARGDARGGAARLGRARHEGTFRSAQVTARITPEQAVELIQELAERAREAEDPSQAPIVITTVLHPPTTVDLQGSSGELSSTSIPRRRASACSTSTVSATGTSSRKSSRVSNDSSTASIATV